MSFEVFDSTPWPEEKLVPLEVSKGALIVLNGLLPHKSLANRSAKSRHAYTLHVISADSQLSRIELAATLGGNAVAEALTKFLESAKSGAYQISKAPSANFTDHTKLD